MKQSKMAVLGASDNEEGENDSRLGLVFSYSTVLKGIKLIPEGISFQYTAIHWQTWKRRVRGQRLTSV